MRVVCVFPLADLSDTAADFELFSIKKLVTPTRSSRGRRSGTRVFSPLTDVRSLRHACGSKQRSKSARRRTTHPPTLTHTTDFSLSAVFCLLLSSCGFLLRPPRLWLLCGVVICVRGVVLLLLFLFLFLVQRHEHQSRRVALHFSPFLLLLLLLLLHSPLLVCILFLPVSELCFFVRRFVVFFVVSSRFWRCNNFDFLGGDRPISALGRVRSYCSSFGMADSHCSAVCSCFRAGSLLPASFSFSSL
jgi:hypothetical protein